MFWILAQTAAASPESWPWNFVTQVGLSVALVIFFVVRDAQRQKADALENTNRETKLNTRIETLEEFNREVLLSMNTKCTESLSHSSAAIDRCTVAIETNSRVLERIGGK